MLNINGWLNNTKWSKWLLIIPNWLTNWQRKLSKYFITCFFFFSAVVEVSLGSRRNALLLMVPFGNDFEEGVGFMLKMFISVKYWNTSQVRVMKKLICGTSPPVMRISSSLIIEHIEVSKTVVDMRFVPFAAQKRSSTWKKYLKIIFSCYYFPSESSWRQLRWTRDE